MLTVREMKLLFSSIANTHGEMAHHPYHVLRRREKMQDSAQLIPQPTASRYGRYPTLPICLHQSVKPTDLSRYCHCSDRYPVPSVALTSLKCAKQVTDSGTIHGRCSINYVQFIKLHLTQGVVNAFADLAEWFVVGKGISYTLEFSVVTSMYVSAVYTYSLTTSTFHRHMYVY